MMTEVTKYQLFLDNMKLILKFKDLIDEKSYFNAIEKCIDSICKKNKVSDDDINDLKNFMFNLNKENFYDECMLIYHKFLKYDEYESFNILSFQKVQLIDMFVN